MRKAVLCFCLLSLNLALFGATDRFEHDERFVTGILRDQHNHPRVATALTVIEQHTNSVLETETDSQGRFNLWLNPDATYQVFAAGDRPFTILPTQILAAEPKPPEPTTTAPIFSLAKATEVRLHETLPVWRDGLAVNSTEPETEEDPEDPGNPNNGGVSVSYGDPPDHGGTNGEDPPPADSHQRPQAGGVGMAATLMSNGNRLALTLTSGDLSSRHGLIRKLRLVGQLRTGRPDQLFFEQVTLDSELVSDGQALISIQPSPAGTFDLEIEALGDASLNVNGTLLAFELVHTDEHALFAVQETLDLSLIRVEPKRGRLVRYATPPGR